MKPSKAISIILLILACSLSVHAQAVRIDSNVMTTNPACIPGSLCPLLSVPGATIQVCTDAACASSATTYTSASGAACPANAQVTLAGSPQCQSTTGAQGDFGFWITPGQYFYSVVFPNGTVVGPYAVSTSNQVINFISTTSPITGTNIIGCPSCATVNGNNVFTGSNTFTQSILPSPADTINLGSPSSSFAFTFTDEVDLRSRNSSGNFVHLQGGDNIATNYTFRFPNNQPALNQVLTVTSAPSVGIWQSSWITPTVPSSGYMTIESNGTPVPARSILNFVSGANSTVNCADDPALGSSDCTVSSSGGGGGGGGVTQIIAGDGISISPIGGTGVVTVTNSSTGGSCPTCVLTTGLQTISGTKTFSINQVFNNQVNLIWYDTGGNLISVLNADVDNEVNIGAQQDPIDHNGILNFFADGNKELILWSSFGGTPRLSPFVNNQMFLGDQTHQFAVGYINQITAGTTGGAPADISLQSQDGTLNYVTVRSGSAVAGTYVLDLPNSLGAIGQVLTLTGTTQLGWSSGTGYSTIDSAGTPITQRSTVNFISGANMTVSCVDNSGASRSDCTFVAGAGAGGYATIDSNGSAITQRATVNFISGTNATVTCVDNSGASRSDCTISASAGSGYSTIDSNGSAITQRATVNFISGTGATVTCVDNSGASRSDCTVTASGAGVTNIATAAPLTGGPITTTGTISCPTCVITTGLQTITGTKTFAITQVFNNNAFIDWYDLGSNLITVLEMDTSEGVDIGAQQATSTNNGILNFFANGNKELTLWSSFGGTPRLSPISNSLMFLGDQTHQFALGYINALTMISTSAPAIVSVESQNHNGNYINIRAGANVGGTYYVDLPNSACAVTQAWQLINSIQFGCFNPATTDTTQTITGQKTFTADLLPSPADTVNIGSSSARWATVYEDQSAYVSRNLNGNFVTIQGGDNVTSSYTMRLPDAPPTIGQVLSVTSNPVGTVWQTSWGAGSGGGFPTGAWTPYSPAVLNMTSTVTNCAYLQAGKTIFFECNVSGTSNGLNITISTPFTMADSSRVTFSSYITQSGGTVSSTVVPNAPNSIRMGLYNNTAIGAGLSTVIQVSGVFDSI